MHNPQAFGGTTAPLLNRRWDQVPREIAQHKNAISDTMTGYGILEGTQAQIAVILDVSASMEGLYKSGKVQTLINKALGLAACLDDDGKVQIFPFGSTCSSEPVVATFENFKTVIEAEILSKGYQGGTNYANAVNAVIEHYFKNGQRTATDAVYVFFITDGKPNDPILMKIAFKEASSLPIFFKIITLTNIPTKFDDLTAIDEATDHFIDNCDHKNYTDPDKLSPKDMLDEFPQYLHEAYQKGLITTKPNLDEYIVTKPRESEHDDAPDASPRIKTSRGCCAIL